jgi:hypothetical protein
VEIREEQVEYAVVDRLREMINKPPQTRYNVTQRFAMFSTVVLWTKNRAWVAGKKDKLPLSDPADISAHDVREAMRLKLITENRGYDMRSHTAMAGQSVPFTNRSAPGKRCSPVSASRTNGSRYRYTMTTCGELVISSPISSARS